MRTFDRAHRNSPGVLAEQLWGDSHERDHIPVSTISDGVGLNITVHSYADRMDFGLISDRDLVPDLWHLVDLHIDKIGRLFEATGAEWAVPQPPPPMRKGGDGVGAVAPSSKAVKDRVAADHTRSRSPSIQPKPGATKRAVAENAIAKEAVANKAVPKKVVAKKTVAKEGSSTYRSVALGSCTFLAWIRQKRPDYRAHRSAHPLLGCG